MNLPSFVSLAPMLRALLPLALIGVGTPACRAADPAIGARLDSLIAPAAAAECFSGVVLVAREDRVVYRRAVGYADWNARRPNEMETRFGIASITKVLTETMVDGLVRSGRLDLETPVERHLEGFPRGPGGGAPTVGELLAHRAGVPHRVTTGSEEARSLGPAEIVERVKEAGLLDDPGRRRRYSSAGFTTLARVLEVAEEKPFARLLEERVLEPAGMSATTDASSGTPNRELAAPHVLGVVNGRLAVRPAPEKHLGFLTGAGSVYSTAGDLHRLIEAMRNGVFGDDFWDRAVDADAASWQGWTGRTNGYEAFLDVLPRERLTLVVLTNLQSVANWQLRERIRELLLGKPVEPVALPPPVAPTTEPPLPLVGTYANESRTVEIALRDGRLFRGDNEFYPIGDGRYYVPASGSVMWFRREGSGSAAALVWERGDDEIVLPRVD